MALTSPGLQITVTDESQYVPGTVGTVPLVVLATAQNKIFNGATTSGTTKNTAGTLQSFGSQRELVSAFGYPVFKQSAAGTPLHGAEQNEYGLMAAYSALGLGNRLYTVRADIDLDQLEASNARPTGSVDNGTYWLDLANTKLGIYEWDLDEEIFILKNPIIVDNSAQTENTGPNGLAAPVNSIGNKYEYAVVTTDANNPVYIKNKDNNWVLVGSIEWSDSFPSVTGTVINPVLDNTGYEITINGANVTLSGTSLSSVISDINAALAIANLDGVTADSDDNDRLIFRVTSQSASNGVDADGIVEIDEIDPGVLEQLGIAAGNYNSLIVNFGSYVEVPSWRATDANETRPNYSVWIKTSSVGNGASFAVKIYNTTTEQFTTVAAPLYSSEVEALATLDSSGGGLNIDVGSLFTQYDILGEDTVTYKLFRRTAKGVTKIIGTNVTPSFNASHSITISATSVGSESINGPVTITAGGTTAAALVASILAADIPYVTAAVESNGAVSITHTAGGLIAIDNVGGGTIITSAGFNNATNVRIDPASGSYFASNFKVLSPSYTASTTTPFQAPADGTLWYYGDAATVDVMVNNNGWKGYRMVTNDARGYNLSNTDPGGVIVSASKPVNGDRSDGGNLVPGDLWLDTSDLDNYPSLYRYTGASWEAINNADSINQNGIIFADARWDTDGTTNVVSGELPEIADLLTSAYIDLDAPDWRLYPRGMLLFNTRRSGFNVKQYVANKFNDVNYPDGSIPDVAATWQTASGNKEDGSPYTGTQAQRRMVVKALKAAIAANTDIREDRFDFSLICAPGYPELIPDMVALNNDRKNTAFVIGDTPLTLPANSVQITNWSNGINGVYGEGLTTADPYLGVFYPAALTTDVQGNTIVQPASHMMLRTFIRSDNNSFQWFAPAGTRRGLIDNASRVGYLSTSGNTNTFIETGVNQALRDSMYLTNVNPITVLPGIGLVAFGQKTRNGTASALDRINVSRLVNYIRTILANVGNGFLFEPNDKITRDQLKQIIEGALNDLIAKRGIFDYLVVCDTTNNTPDRVARNELYVDIAIAPVKSVEFIYIPIRLKNPGDIDQLQ